MTPEEIAQMQSDLETANKSISKLNDENAKARIANRELKEKGDAALQEDADELARLKEVEAASAEKQQLAEGKYEEVMKQRDKAREEAEMEFTQQIANANDGRVAAESKYENVVISNSILSAAATANAINPEDVSMLIRNNVSLNKDGKIEVSVGGELQRDDDGKPLTVSSYVKAFLETRPNMIQGKGGGSNSQGGSGKSKTQNLNTPLDRIKAGLEARKA